MTIEQELRPLLAAIPILAARPASEWRATLLAGLTNRNWRLIAGDLDLVLRVPGSSSQRYLSRKQEQHNAGLAARLGIAPALLYADPDSGVTLQPFLAGARTLSRDDFADPVVAREVGRLLARLHRSGVRFRGTMAAFPVIDIYLSLAADDRLLALRAAAEPIRVALERRVPELVPSHIDPNPANFLLLPEGGLRLIDWEFSAMCEPAWDLAAVSLEGAMGAAAISAFYDGYGLAPDPAASARLWLMRAALHLVAASWTYAEVAGGNPAAGLTELLDDRLSRLERKLGDPALGRWLEIAG